MKRLVLICLLVAISGCVSPKPEGPAPRLTATPTAEVRVTSSPSTAVATLPPAAVTPAPTVLVPDRPTATSTPYAPQPGDRSGTPFSTALIRDAIRQANRTFWPAERARLCGGTSVPEVVFWGASTAGTDYGPRWALWVYPDRAALDAQWAVDANSVASPTTAGCRLPTAFNYANGNAVLAFVAWWGEGGEQVHDPLRSPGDDAVKAAFVHLAPMPR